MTSGGPGGSNNHINEDMDFTQTSGFEYMNLGDASEAERKVIYDILFKNPQTAHSQEVLFKDLRPHPGEYLSTVVPNSPTYPLHPHALQNHIGGNGLYTGAPLMLQVQQQHQNGPVLTSPQQVMMMDPQHQQQGQGQQQGIRNYFQPSGNLIQQNVNPVHIPFPTYATQVQQHPHGVLGPTAYPHPHYPGMSIQQIYLPPGVPPPPTTSHGIGDDGGSKDSTTAVAGAGRSRSKGPGGSRAGGPRRNDDQQQQSAQGQQQQQPHYAAPSPYYPPNLYYYNAGAGGPQILLHPTNPHHPSTVYAPHIFQQQQQPHPQQQPPPQTSVGVSLSAVDVEHSQLIHVQAESSSTFIPTTKSEDVNGPTNEPPHQQTQTPGDAEESSAIHEPEHQIEEQTIPITTAQIKIPSPEPDTKSPKLSPKESTSTTEQVPSTPAPEPSESQTQVQPEPQLQTRKPTPQESNPDFPVLGALTNGPPVTGPPAGRSWASIARSSNPSSTNGPTNGTRALTPDFKSGTGSHESGDGSHNYHHVPIHSSGSGEYGGSSTSGPALSEASYQSLEDDPLAYPLGEFLASYTLNHHSLSLTPRGLSNQGNWCYINATLQSLIACPPMVNLFRSMERILGRKICKSSPILQSVFDFIMEFEPITRFNQNNKNKRPQDAFYIGASFEPVGIRRVLGLLDGATFKVEGRQEDAEEFLSHLLNGLHDEMTKLIKFYETKRERRLIPGSGTKPRATAPTPSSSSQSLVVIAPTQTLPPPTITTNGDAGSGPEMSIGDSQTGTAAAGTTTAEDEEWQIMGPKNKGSMTRKTETSRTPISEMFLGQYSSLLHRGTGSGTIGLGGSGTHPKTTTLQPFFTLQLDIQDDNIHNVRDALDGLSAKEELSCSSGINGQETPMWKQLSLEVLPIILVVHLKRFVYDKSSSKISKLTKRVDFGIDLDIPKDLLSINCKSKISNVKQRLYKLFAAVYHDGEEVHKGHYIADTFHPSGGSLWGQFGWIRYDDTTVKGINEGQILNPHPPRVPYLLYYRRVDTLSQSKKIQERDRERYGGGGGPISSSQSATNFNDNRQ